MVLVVTSDSLIRLLSAPRRRLPTAWSQSLWGWTASCREACRPLWPSTLWPTRCSDHHSASGSLNSWLWWNRLAERLAWWTNLGDQNQKTSCFTSACIYLCIYLFLWLVKTENAKKQDLWSESKRKLGNTASFETSLSYSYFLFSTCDPESIVSLPHWSHKSVWCLTNNLIQSTGTQSKM